MHRQSVRLSGAYNLSLVHDLLPGERACLVHGTLPRAWYNVGLDIADAQNFDPRLLGLEVHASAGDTPRATHAHAEDVDLWQLLENLRTCPPLMGLPVPHTVILAEVDHLVRALAQISGPLNRPPDVGGVGVSWATVEHDLESEELQFSNAVYRSLI